MQIKCGGRSKRRGMTSRERENEKERTRCLTEWATKNPNSNLKPIEWHTTTIATIGCVSRSDGKTAVFVVVAVS